MNDIDIPVNFKVLTLPSIELAEDYPTIGPSGLANLNINGTACSIEFFLGKDVLLDDEGIFEPVIWTQYMEKYGRFSIKKYQGALLHKAAVQERFRKKLAKLKKCDRVQVKIWPEIKNLLELISSLWT